MADAKVTTLTELTAVTSDDLFYAVNDPAGTPASRKVTAATLKNFIAQSHNPGGRLTLESGVPISTSDQTAKTSIYYTPYVHNTINLWDGTSWIPVTFTEMTQALGTITSGLEYNVYGYLSSGAFATEIAAWGSATVTFTNGTDVVNWTSTPAVDGDMFSFSGGTAPTGLANFTTYYVRDKAANSFKLASTPGGAAINFTTDGSGTITGKLQNVTYQDGRLCKNGDKTRLLLGTFYTTSTTTTAFAEATRYLANVYNRVPITVRQVDTTSHTINNVSQPWRNGSALQAGFVVPIPVKCNVMVAARIDASTTSSTPFIYPDLNGSVIDSNDFVVSQNVDATSLLARSHAYCTIGRNYAEVWEAEFASVNATVDQGKVYAEVML